VSFHAALRNGTKSVFLRVEEAFDSPFGGQDNPLRHLGAMGLYLLWIVVGSGLYLYTVLDTGIDAVYHSIGYLSNEQWYLGGVLRSLHRYASDGFMLVMMLHLLREWSYGRYYGFRLYSWMTGIPLIWLAYIAGIGGYWIVWDELAQLSADRDHRTARLAADLQRAIGAQLHVAERDQRPLLHGPDFHPSRRAAATDPRPVGTRPSRRSRRLPADASRDAGYRRRPDPARPVPTRAQQPAGRSGQRSR
jgi:hypothetical protein